MKTVAYIFFLQYINSTELSAIIITEFKSNSINSVDIFLIKAKILYREIFTLQISLKIEKLKNQKISIHGRKLGRNECINFYRRQQI